MKKIIIYVLLVCCFQGLISCLPGQKDEDETLTIIPPKKLSAAEIAALNDTAKCVFTTSWGWVDVTLDSNLNLLPAPRGYYDFTGSILSSSDDYAVRLLYNSLSSYDDELMLTFYNSATSHYGIKAGVYGTDGLYGNGRVEIRGKYMTNGYWGERAVSIIGNPKIYVKKAADGIDGYEIIFCNVKMNWNYMVSSRSGKYYYTPVTLNGRVFVPD